MTTYYVGLDVHSKQASFVIEDKGGKVIAQSEIATTAKVAAADDVSLWAGTQVTAQGSNLRPAD
jgi:hypothetical protein